MSDEAAPVEPASAEQTAPVETKAPEAEPKAKPRTIDDDLEDVLKKHGGYKYKAAGKEKSITAAKDLQQMLSRVGGLDSVASEALKAKEEAAGIKAKISSLVKLKPAERIQALVDMGISKDSITEAFTEDVLASSDKEKARAHLSQRERELEDERDAVKAKLATYEQQKADWEREQEENAHVAKSSALYEKITSIAAKALQKAKIAGQHAPTFLPAIAEEIDRMERLGLDYNEDDIAETVMAERGAMARDYYAGLDVEAHLEELRGMEVPDPKDPTKKTTKLKLMLLAEAARIRASLAGAVPVATSTITPRPVVAAASRSDEMAFWRSR